MLLSHFRSSSSSPQHDLSAPGWTLHLHQMLKASFTCSLHQSSQAGNGSDTDWEKTEHTTAPLRQLSVVPTCETGPAPVQTKAPSSLRVRNTAIVSGHANSFSLSL